jgi:hypothetical protein
MARGSDTKWLSHVTLRLVEALKFRRVELAFQMLHRPLKLRPRKDTVLEYFEKPTLDELDGESRTTQHGR